MIYVASSTSLECSAGLANVSSKTRILKISFVNTTAEMPASMRPATSRPSVMK